MGCINSSLCNVFLMIAFNEQPKYVKTFAFSASLNLLRLNFTGKFYYTAFVYITLPTTTYKNKTFWHQIKQNKG